MIAEAVDIAAAQTEQHLLQRPLANARNLKVPATYRLTQKPRAALASIGKHFASALPSLVPR